MVDVVEVTLDPPVEVLLLPRIDLPQPGDAGLHRKPSSMPDVVPGDLGRKGRTRPDEAHVAAKDVPDLRYQSPPLSVPIAIKSIMMNATPTPAAIPRIPAPFGFARADRINLTEGNTQPTG